MTELKKATNRLLVEAYSRYYALALVDSFPGLVEARRHESLAQLFQTAGPDKADGSRCEA